MRAASRARARSSRAAWTAERSSCRFSTAGSSGAGLARNLSNAVFLALAAEARRSPKPGSLKLMSVDLVLRVLGASTHTEASKIEKPPRGAASACGSKSHHAIGNLRGLDVVDGDLARATVLGGVERHLLAF